METIHSIEPIESHLQGLSLEEIKFIRTLANIAVDITLSQIDENSTPIHSDLGRRSV